MQQLSLGGSLPPLQARCVEPVPLQKARVDIWHLKRLAGGQRLQLVGEIKLPYPFVPALDPANNGLRLVLRAAQGRTLLELLIPGAYDSAGRSGWEIQSEETTVQFLSVDGLYDIALGWGAPDRAGVVGVRVMARDDNLVVGDGDLPLYAQLTLTSSHAATRQCAETSLAKVQNWHVDHFLCYKAKTARGTPKFEKRLGVNLRDQFANREFDLKKPTPQLSATRRTRMARESTTAIRILPAINSS